MPRRRFAALVLIVAAHALRPTRRRQFFVNARAFGASAAAAAVAAPARADGGVPMDLGPLGLRNGGSGKLNSCPPQGIKRGCVSTSKFETDFYVPPWTYASEKDDSKSVETAVAELAAAIEAQPGTVIVDRGTKADGRYIRAEVRVDGGPFGGTQIDDVEFLVAAPGSGDPPHLVDYHSVTRSGGSADAKRHRERIKAIRLELQDKGWKSVGRLLL